MSNDYLDASLAATEWIMTTVRTDQDTCAAFHHDPGGTEQFTLGWCHGPPGLGWLFRQLELTTGEAGWRTWLRRAARADLVSGIPARREPGFWDNVARCCGSAGVAEFFLDLHQLEASPGTWPSPSPWWTTSSTGLSGSRGNALVELRVPAPEPGLPPETTSSREHPASAPRCCACTATWPGTHGRCAGRHARPGPRLNRTVR